MCKNSQFIRFCFVFFSVYLFFSCSTKKEEDPIPTADEVIKLTEKVANAYIENKSDDSYNAMLYSGMFQLSKESHYPKYINRLIEKGEENKWQIPQKGDKPVDYSISQFYLSIFQKPHLGRKELLIPTQKYVRSVIDDTLKTHQWKTIEDLYLQPSVLAKLSQIEKDTTYGYLDYMHAQYQSVYRNLWDNEKQLFKNPPKDKTSHTITPSFLLHTNSRVSAGLAYLISDLPDKWEHKAFYEELFQQIALSLKDTQTHRSDSYFAFGIAWGVNNGLLDQTTYEPILLHAWAQISEGVENGDLQLSESLNKTRPNESSQGIGGFLAAGSEMFRYITEFYPIDKLTSHTTFMEDGGWCWYQDPRVLISNNNLIIAGLSGVSGDARIGIFDLKEQQQDTTIVLAQDIGADDHNVPALYKRPDKRILAVWAKHAKEKKHYSSISKAYDYRQWSAVDTFEHQYKKGPGVTYMNLHYLEDEGKLYNFFRDGTNFNPSFITSSDHGKTWGNRTHFISNDVEGFQRPYAKYLQVDENTIGISYTDAHPRRFGNNLFYVEFKNNKFYTVEGDFIKSLDDGPLSSSSAERIYSGGDTMKKPPINESVPNSAWTTTMAKDENNHPHIGYTLYLNDSDIRFRIASWDGKQWNDREIAYAGKSLYKIESSYSGLLAFDPEDPSSVFISTDVNPSTGEDLGGNHEIYKAKIDPEDNISTIKWEAVTSNSPHRNIRPIVVSEDGYKVLLWLYGPWKTFKNYDANVIGKILKRP